MIFFQCIKLKFFFEKKLIFCLKYFNFFTQKSMFSSEKDVNLHIKNTNYVEFISF